jgi:hypothetical protein
MNATINGPSGETWFEMTERTSRDTAKGLLSALVCETRYIKEFNGVTTSHPDKFAVVVETTKPGEQTRRTWRLLDSIEAGKQMIAEQFAKIPQESR